MDNEGQHTCSLNIPTAIIRFVYHHYFQLYWLDCVVFFLLASCSTHNKMGDKREVMMTCRRILAFYCRTVRGDTNNDRGCPRHKLV